MIELCTCDYIKKYRVEGRLVVCDTCGKPRDLPHCVDCKWYHHDELKTARTHRCTYPIDKGIDIVTGEKLIENNRDAYDFRKDGGRWNPDNCGERARYFEWNGVSYPKADPPARYSEYTYTK